MAGKKLSSRQLRLATAGRYLLEGCSLKQALIKAGYKPVTARNPERNKISADRCLAALNDLDPSADPATILENVRTLVDRKVKDVLGDDEQLKKTRLAELARLQEVAERWYGDRSRPNTDDNPTLFVDKIEWLRKVLAELDRRRSGEVLDARALEAQEQPAEMNSPKLLTNGEDLGPHDGDR